MPFLRPRLPAVLRAGFPAVATKSPRIAMRITLRITLRVALPIALPIAMLILWSAAGLPAQAVDGKILGVVRDATNRPWSGARVFLLSRPVPDDERIGKPDLIRTRTDKDGRFRAEVWRGRTYTVWAQSDLDDEGRYRITKVVEDAFAGPPIQLKEENLAPRRQIRMRLRGLDRWKHRAPFRFQLVSRTKNVHVVKLEPKDPENMALPVMPGTAQTLEVYDKNGIPIYADRDVPCVQRMRWRPHTTWVRAPKKLRFAVHDISSAKPIGEARILLRLRRQLVPVGKTGADGYALLELPDPESRTSPRGYLVATSGHGLGYFVASDGNEKQLGAIPSRLDQKVFAFANLVPQKQVAGRIVPGAGATWRGVEVIAHLRASFYRRARAYGSMTVPWWAQLDDRGGFRLPGSSRSAESRIQLVLTAPERLGPSFTGVHRVLPGVAYRQDEGSNSLAIRLGELRPIEFLVLDHRGAPAAGGKVVFLDPRRRPERPKEDFTISAAGRLRVLLPAGRPLVCMARRGELTAAAVLDMEAAAGDTSLVRVRLTLRRPWLISGTVKSGRGIPSARVYVRLRQYAGRRAEPEWEADAGRRVADGVRQRELRDWRYSGPLLSMFQIPRKQTRTDSEGRFRMKVPALPMKWQLWTLKDPGAAHAGSYKTVELKDRSVTKVQLQLR